MAIKYVHLCSAALGSKYLHTIKHCAELGPKANIAV